MMWNTKWSQQRCNTGKSGVVPVYPAPTNTELLVWGSEENPLWEQKRTNSHVVNRFFHFLSDGLRSAADRKWEDCGLCGSCSSVQNLPSCMVPLGVPASMRTRTQTVNHPFSAKLFFSAYGFGFCRPPFSFCNSLLWLVCFFVKMSLFFGLIIVYKHLF